ncbi:hypothetical protein MKW92_031132 [Papaver armeniacum]|nr:hypothetical protein MKW92_031132 [Papaver armeniacum]
MRPSMDPKKMKLDNIGTLRLTQTWHKYGACPQGSIPVRRIEKYYRSTLLHKRRHLELPLYNTSLYSFGNGHEYATVQVHGNFLGARAKINLWNPVVEVPRELSLSQIWVIAGDGDDLNTIEAGWEAGNYKYGCHNLECEGFVHTSSEIALGCNFTEVSTFKGDQKDATFSIHKDLNSGNWWIQVQGIPVGYYPSSLFTQLSKTATEIDFGGEIINWAPKGRHTMTQMGSGHFPSEGGLGISSYFNQVQIIDENNKAKDPENVIKYITNPNCYDLRIDDKHTNGFGFYYGGPGYNDKCQ